jgi:glutathione synthase/RimK-type ligase-like ATP-grasp enzyme
MTQRSSFTRSSTVAERDRPIVLLGADDDEHIQFIAADLRARGEEPIVIDPRLFPANLSLSLGAAASDIRVGDHARLVPHSVYVRSLYTDPGGFKSNADQAMDRDWRKTNAALGERWTVLTALLQRWAALGVALYNAADSAGTLNKPYQLALLERAGLPVPRTLWSNDPAAVSEFCAQGEVVYKPVRGGAHTRKVAPRDLEPERLARLRASPVCFQELLPGRNLRVYVVDDEVVCALAVESEELDFREVVPRVTAIELSRELAEQCVRATSLMGLRFTGMDLREDAEGRAKFLELNSSPMFLGFEALAGVRIGVHLSAALARAAR